MCGRAEMNVIMIILLAWVMRMESGYGTKTRMMLRAKPAREDMGDLVQYRCCQDYLRAAHAEL
jgi:hypothetical protein